MEIIMPFSHADDEDPAMSFVKPSLTIGNKYVLEHPAAVWELMINGVIAITK
jgi:hypothetical protein